MGLHGLLLKRLRALRSEERGNVMVMFGFALVPVIGLTGATIDYSRATSARQVLNAAVDSAALMAARDASKLSDSEVRSRIDKWITANLHGESAKGFTSATTVIDRTARTIAIEAQLNIDTSLTRLIGQDAMTLKSKSQSTWGTNTIELALALDNTGSMASSGKMAALKTASLNLIQIMKDASTETDQIKISIVPFNLQVRLPAAAYKDEPWMGYGLTRCDSRGNNCETMTKAKWQESGQGCIADRDQPYDTTDGETIDSAAKRYPAFWCRESSLATVLPLTANWTDLTNKINSMTPVGNTNVTIGAAWGLATLSSSQPFTQGKPTATPRLSKYMILLTDGENTENRFTTNSTAIDLRTAAACTNVKAAGVRLYTIRVIDGDRTLLRNCATDPSMYYEVSNASQLTPVFQQIAREISQVRLTQ